MSSSLGRCVITRFGRHDPSAISASTRVLVLPPTGDTRRLWSRWSDATFRWPPQTRRSARPRGSGALVLVSGDAGIGKSRLVQEITQRAVSRGMTRADGFAVDDPGAPPLWPWRRALRDLPDVLAASDDVATDADAGRFAMFVAVTDRLLCAVVTTGIVVVLEDMHWADRLSVLLLNHLCSELPDSRVAVVISFRPRHPGPLRDGLDRFVGDRVGFQRDGTQ